VKWPRPFGGGSAHEAETVSYENDLLSRTPIFTDYQRSIFYTSAPPTAAIGIWGSWCFECGLAGHIWYRQANGWVRVV
jgi:hypothetical protein